MLNLCDRIRVSPISKRCPGWIGEIVIVNAAKYGIKFDKTPSIMVFFFHKDIAKIK